MGGLTLVGGRLSLDFANTVGWHGSDHPHEHLRTYDDLLAWAVKAGAFDHATAELIREASAADPAEAARALEQAIKLREALYRCLSPIAQNSDPDEDSVADLGTVLTAAIEPSRLAFAGGELQWRWGGRPDSLYLVLWHVARDAIDLLVSPDMARLGECDGGDCGWLFVDVSRNHSRRWCSMGDCGNRAKVRRHYRGRVKQKA